MITILRNKTEYTKSIKYLSILIIIMNNKNKGDDKKMCDKKIEDVKEDLIDLHAHYDSLKRQYQYILNEDEITKTKKIIFHDITNCLEKLLLKLGHNVEAI